MKNYFDNAQVNWNNWTPNDIVFKSNNLTKKLLPAKNVMSWKSKNDRDSRRLQQIGAPSQSHQGWNGQTYTTYDRKGYKAIAVQLMNVKDEFPSANVDFIDYSVKSDSVGNRLGSIDALVYIQSFHNPWEWVRCPQTNQYIKKASGHVAPVDEGYRIAYGGQGDSNPMSFDCFEELFQISRAVKNFLVDCIVPAKNGEFDYDQLLVA